MELLPHFGVNSELSKEEFIRRLGRECTADHVRELRLSLFTEAVRKDLADSGDGLVMRKKVGGGKTLQMCRPWLLGYTPRVRLTTTGSKRQLFSS